MTVKLFLMQFFTKLKLKQSNKNKTILLKITSLKLVSIALLYRKNKI